MFVNYCFYYYYYYYYFVNFIYFVIFVEIVEMLLKKNANIEATDYVCSLLLLLLLL